MIHGGEIKNPKRPRFREDEIRKIMDRLEGLGVYICPNSDLMGDFVSDEVIQLHLNMVGACPRHTFLIHTKSPERLKQWNLKRYKNLWAATTVEGGDRGRYDRSYRIDSLRQCNAVNKAVVIEPWLSRFKGVSFKGIQWVIMGSLDDPRDGLIHPPEEMWVEEVVRDIRRHGGKIWTEKNMGSVFQCREFTLRRNGWGESHCELYKKGKAF